jgi:hypothetical protein
MMNGSKKRMINNYNNNNNNNNNNNINNNNNNSNNKNSILSIKPKNIQNHQYSKIQLNIRL